MLILLNIGAQIGAICVKAHSATGLPRVEKKLMLLPIGHFYNSVPQFEHMSVFAEHDVCFRTMHLLFGVTVDSECVSE